MEHEAAQVVELLTGGAVLACRPLIFAPVAAFALFWPPTQRPQRAARSPALNGRICC